VKMWKKSGRADPRVDQLHGLPSCSRNGLIGRRANQ
jgi:hypothetical protein